jgi:hypothetical protein
MHNGITAVHVTHEAVGKIGGIGAVLEGLFTSRTYLATIERSIITGPLFSTEGPASRRLGKNGQVLYSSIDGFSETEYAPALREIENLYNAAIIYGRRTFRSDDGTVISHPEVLLIDVRYVNKSAVNKLKRAMYEQFGIRSDLYEDLWEYEQYVRLAPVVIACIKALGAARDSTTIISHEFMGMPTALAAVLDTFCDFKTIFYAHEVATIRRIVEGHPGHDMMFYNVMKQAQGSQLYVNEVFGDQSSYFKHPLVDAAKYCDAVCAVGDYTAQELRFLGPEFENTVINVVYNGIPAYEIGIDDKLRSKNRLGKYCENLLGFEPDFVFTHVTRLVVSKGLWRDLRVLEHIEKRLRAQGKTAVMFLLSTEVAQRPGSDILAMESSYNWPVAHREGWPDLSGGEAGFYTTVQRFNARSSNIKIVFINQFGFDPASCGCRMPQDMEFMDVRKGTDVEFGQSVYEPFGISQLEPLSFGGLCVVSSVCGCAGLVRSVNGSTELENIIIADYTDLADHNHIDIGELLKIDRSARECIEDCASAKVAEQIINRLPESRAQIENRIRNGHSLAKNMSWNVIVENYLLPSWQKVLDNCSAVHAART